MDEFDHLFPCNINKEEVTRRKIFGLLSLLVAIPASSIYFVEATWFWLLVSTGGWYAVVLNFLQVQRRFCVSYGVEGVENLEDGIRKLEGEKKKIYRKYAILLVFRAFLITVVIITLLFLITILF